MPIIGNCYQPKIRSLLRHLAELRKTYGKIFTLQIFTKMYLVVLDPVIVRRALSDNKAFVTDKEVSSAFSGMFGNRLLYSEVLTARQRDVKNIVRRIFGNHNVERNLPTMNKLAAQAVEDLINEEMQWMQNFAEDAFIVRVDRFFARLTLRVFMNVAMHSDYRNSPDQERLTCETITNAGRSVQYLLCLTHMMPTWVLAPLHLLLKWRRGSIYKEVASKIRAQMAMREEEELRNPVRIDGGDNVLNNERDDFVTAIKSGELTVEEVAEHMVSLCGAGQDSSSYFASYACLLLAKNPDVQTKLRNAILDEVGDRENITADDIAKLTYMNQVLQEVMRLYAIVPTALRQSTRDVTVKDCSSSENIMNRQTSAISSAVGSNSSSFATLDAGSISHGDRASSGGSSSNTITIPAGTNLLIPLYLMNRDPSMWPDPSAFKPERFEHRWGDLGALGNVNGCTPPVKGLSSPDSSAEFSNARAGYYPYGYGNRTCVGAMLVQTETAIMLCHLLRRVELQPDPNFRCSISAGST